MSVQQLDPPQQEQLNAALGSVTQQLRRLTDVPWLCPVIDPSDHEVKYDGVGDLFLQNSQMAGPESFTSQLPAVTLLLLSDDMKSCDL